MIRIRDSQIKEYLENCYFAHNLFVSKKSVTFANIILKHDDMNITEIPRTLLYKDFETINDIFCCQSEETLEYLFYERLKKRPFIANSTSPYHLILSIFNNARYIYYLVECDENSPSLCFNTYLTKSTENIEDLELKEHIMAATMALIYNLLSLNLRNNQEDVKELNKTLYIKYDKKQEKEIKELNEKIHSYFSEPKDNVTSESIKDFHDLIFNKENIPTKIDTLFEELRDIEEAAINAPIQDVAKGIDYLIECYDSPNDSNGEHYMFLTKILNRFENEKSLKNDSEIIEDAIAKIKQRLHNLLTTPEPKPFWEGISINDVIDVNSEKEKELPLELRENISWIIDKNKAPQIIETLKQYMDEKTKPKDLLMALCAAKEVGAIRKPSMNEYKKVFPEFIIKSPDSFDNWFGSKAEHIYKKSKTAKGYYILIDKFKKIIQN